MLLSSYRISSYWMVWPMCRLYLQTHQYHGGGISIYLSVINESFDRLMVLSGEGHWSSDFFLFIYFTFCLFCPQLGAKCLKACLGIGIENWPLISQFSKPSVWTLTLTSHIMSAIMMKSARPRAVTAEIMRKWSGGIMTSTQTAHIRPAASRFNRHLGSFVLTELTCIQSFIYWRHL